MELVVVSSCSPSRSLLKGQILFVLLGSALAEAWALNQHWPYTQLSNGKWTPLTKIYSDLAMLNHAAFPTDAGQNSTAHIFSLSQQGLIQWQLCFADASGIGPGKQKAWATLASCSLVPPHQRLISVIYLGDATEHLNIPDINGQDIQNVSKLGKCSCRLSDVCMISASLHFFWQDLKICYPS